MIQLCMTCGKIEKMVACIPLCLKHFVYICVELNSRTSRNRYLVGKDKRKQPFSLYQYPGEGGRLINTQLVVHVVNKFTDVNTVEAIITLSFLSLAATLKGVEFFVMKKS